MAEPGTPNKSNATAKYRKNKCMSNRPWLLT
jgi:hypothetical protein